jgi:hypothetical protein
MVRNNRSERPETQDEKAIALGTDAALTSRSRRKVASHRQKFGRVASRNLRDPHAVTGGKRIDLDSRFRGGSTRA